MGGMDDPKRELVYLRPRTHQDYIGESHSVLVTGANGFINQGTEEGLRVFQTRSISRLEYLIDGKPFEPVSLSAVRLHNWLGYYIAPPPGSGSGTQKTVELKVSRFAGHGLHEELDLTNYSQERVAFTFAIAIAADFADQNEAGSRDREATGSLTTEWRPGENPELVFEFHAEHAYHHQGENGVARVHQIIAVRVRHSDTPALYAEGCISFPVELEPKAHWHACFDYVPTLGGKTLEPLYSCGAFRNEGNGNVRKRDSFLKIAATRFTVENAGEPAAGVHLTIEQAARDLAALRLHDLDRADGWVPAAGLPEFVALFGRDSLTAAWQASLLSPELLRGVLPALAALQGKADNPWRDEQPDKMMHQAANRLTAELNFNPFKLYYGSITTSAVFPFALAALWQQTGDGDLARQYIDPALRAIHWRDTGGDLDGDGFGEYLCRSEKGLKNQGWKDSGDAIVYEDGSQVEPPIATCEEQGFLYVAKLRMAEMLWWLGRKDESKRLFHEAGELKKRFNDAFWMDDKGYFALGLDAKKRQIRSIASNPGHLLATAIVDSSLARRTADRLMMDDLFSGWGVRTLSSYHPAYDPYAYQRGCVWPAENGLFALGFLRYGLHHYVERLTQAQFDAAALFLHHRLPEAFGGHPRDRDHPFPAVYPKANWPQAWSSAAVYLYIIALLGLFPYAPLNLLFVDPHLPEWLPEITMSNLHIGQAIVDIRFCRKESGESDFEVRALRGKLHVVRQPSPWSLTADAGERFADILRSFAK